MSSVFASIHDSLSLGNVFLLSLLLFLLHYLMVLYEFRSMPPGPRLSSLPVLGNIFSLEVNAEKLTDAFRSLRENYGGIFSLKLGSYKVVMAATSEAVKEMLVTKSGDFAGRPQTFAFYNITLGGKDIILGNCSPAWRFHRKIFTTALRQYLSNTPLTESRVNTQAKKMVNFMRQQDGKPFDPAKCLMRTVADVICGIIFKEGCDTMNQDLERLLKLNANFIANAGDIQEATILDFFPWGRYLPVKSYDRIFKVFDEIHSIIRKFVRERKDTFDPTEKVGDFLASLLSAQHDLQCESYEEESRALLSEDHFVVAIEDMFLAGYETTSTTLRFVISFLVRFPDYQKDIQRQLDEVVGSREPSLDDRPNLPLIQATILEALRVGNVLPLAVSHVALTDTTLCGYRVPKDTIVFANTESVHLDPSCWEDPDVFNPYRHIDVDGKLITNQGNFYPFGAGRRVCAGESLAKVELFLFVSWLLQSFTFIQVEENLPKLKGAFVQFPDRYKIRAIKRTLPTGN